MSNNNDNERNKLLLDLMLHAYDEDNDRNELIDNKNSQMIIFTGAILTLQATLLSNSVIEYIIPNNTITGEIKLTIMVGLITSFIIYLLALCFFIKAYRFSKDFYSVPNPSLITYYEEHNYKLKNVQSETINNLKDTIIDNSEVIEEKLNDGNKGFKILILGFISTILLLIIIFSVLWLV